MEGAQPQDQVAAEVTAQRVKPRRPHHKSRNGCLQCKGRKIKVRQSPPVQHFSLVFVNFMCCLSRQSWRLSSLRCGVEVGLCMDETRPRTFYAQWMLMRTFSDDSVLLLVESTTSSLLFGACRSLKESSWAGHCPLCLTRGQCHPIEG